MSSAYVDQTIGSSIDIVIITALLIVKVIMLIYSRVNSGKLYARSREFQEQNDNKC